MCAGCATNAEALVLGGLGATTAATCLVQRVAHALQGRTSSQRRAAAHEANAAFLRTLGHEPAAVLGPAPRPSAASPSIAAVARARPGA